MVSSLFKGTIAERCKLPDNLKGRSIHAKIIPTVCNLENMLDRLVEVNGDYKQLKPWEKRSYQSYNIDKIKNRIIYSQKQEWKEIIRKHILEGRPSELGASCIDIYLVAYVSVMYGSGRENFFNYIKENNISEKYYTAQAIWQVGKGDGVYLGILNKDGTIRDWDFMKRWAMCEG